MSAMNKRWIFLCAFCIHFANMSMLTAQRAPNIVVLREDGFLAADSAVPCAAQLQELFPESRFASTQELPALLESKATRLFVLPYGSAFPEYAWTSIQQYLDRGGNLLVIGGRPFTRSAYRDASGWHLREYSVRFTRPLMIDQYQNTAGSEGLEFQTNSDLQLQIPAFTWKQAFSP